MQTHCLNPNKGLISAMWGRNKSKFYEMSNVSLANMTSRIIIAFGSSISKVCWFLANAVNRETTFWGGEADVHVAN